jgi:hypothetical protein
MGINGDWDQDRQGSRETGINKNGDQQKRRSTKTRINGDGIGGDGIGGDGIGGDVNQQRRVGPLCIYIYVGIYTVCLTA